MKISRLAQKKLGMLLGTTSYEREKSFIDTYLIPSINKTIISCGLTLNEAQVLSARCEEFDIMVLGYETSYESPYGLNTIIFEEYCNSYEPGWWYQALSDLQSEKIVDHIIPVIEIPVHVIEKYLC